MSAPLIRLDSIVAAYPGRPVLTGVSLRLDAGERLGLAGANGTGKSTLLHAVVGLHPVESGTITVLGRPRRTEKDFHEVRRRVGLLFQDSDDQLFCPTVIEDVAFGPLNLGRQPEEARAVALHTLTELGCEEFAGRVTHRLSGGEKRLVALATILAMEPEILLLDEPTAGLDETARERLTIILERRSQAMIVVSHDDRFLQRLATRVVVLASGMAHAAELHAHPHRHIHAHLHVREEVPATAPGHPTKNHPN